MVPDRISREVVIDASPDEVWAIVTEPSHVARWFSDEAEIDLRPGGDMLLTWHGHGTYRGRVEAVDPPHSFAFRWLRREDNEPGDGTSTLVEFLLMPGRLRARGSASSKAASNGWPGPTRTRSDTPARTPTAGSTSSTSSATTQQASAVTATVMTGQDPEADRLWAAIADPTRQQLLDRLLASGEATATALARDLPITRQGIAKHLAVLERAGLVEAHPHRTRGQIHRPRGPPRPSHPTDGADPRQVGRPPRQDQTHRRERARVAAPTSP